MCLPAGETGSDRPAAPEAGILRVTAFIRVSESCGGQRRPSKGGEKPEQCPQGLFSASKCSPRRDYLMLREWRGVWEGKGRRWGRLAIDWGITLINLFSLERMRFSGVWGDWAVGWRRGLFVLSLIVQLITVVLFTYMV